MMRFTRRERALFFGLVLFVSAWSVFVFAVKPTVDRVETLGRVIPEKNKDLQQLRAKSAQYLALQARLDDLKRRAGLKETGFEPLSFLESTTRECGLTEKVTAMKQEVSQLDSNYCETVVQIEMKDLTFKQMVDFLLKINSSNHFLRIKSLYAKKNAGNQDLLDTVIRVSTVKASEQ
jgi:type II secretory pathway component PulM